MVSKAALRSKCCFKRTASYVLLLLFGESHSQATEAAPKEQQDLPFARIPLRKHAYNARKKNEFSVSRSYRLAAIPCNSISLVFTSPTTCQLSSSLVVLWRGDNRATCVWGRHRLTRVQCELLGIFHQSLFVS